MENKTWKTKPRTIVEFDTRSLSVILGGPMHGLDTIAISDMQAHFTFRTKLLNKNYGSENDAAASSPCHDNNASDSDFS